MADQARQTPIDWDAEDERRFAEFKSRSDYAELPSLNRAMWPGDFRSKIDVSDYNDRYLKIPLPGFFYYILYLASGWHTAAFFFCIIYPLYIGQLGFWVLIPYFGISLPAIGMLFLTFIILKDPMPILNRQAQVVHQYVAGQVINIHWKDLTPFVKVTPISRKIELESKIPKKIKDNPDWPPARRRLSRGGPWPGVSPWLDPLDCVDVESNLQRLEFIRRYMEEGISAIQPSPGVTPYKPVHHPMKRARAEGVTFYRVFMECVYWFGAGPLVDLWIKWLRSKADWPEEVYHLCAPGADLSEFDTTLVHPDPDVFYRYQPGGGYYLCDRDGERIS